MLEHFDPLDMTDPHPFYAWARRKKPLFYNNESKCWIVSKHSDVHAILADEKRFSAEADRASYAGLSPEATAILQPIAFEQLYGLSTTENPSHDRIKKVVWPLFNELFLSQLKPQLYELAEAYIHSFEGDREVDLVAKLFHEFPAEAIFRMLGVPNSDVAQVKTWSSSRLSLTWGDATDQVRNAHNVVHYWNYCRELVERKISEPGNDMPSKLGTFVNDGVMSLHEAQLFCYGLMFSGHATTSAFLAESMRLLLSSGTWDKLVAGGYDVGSTVDEMLRLCPSAFTRRRLALDDVDIRGQRIKAGETILLVIGSANRDEDVFADPNEVQWSRKDANKHLSFGYGFHYCIGAKVVKLEYATLLGQLMNRFPKLQIVPDHVPSYQRNLSIRMADSLMVILR